MFEVDIRRQEGPFQCRNATIQNNDLGPCGSDRFQEVRAIRVGDISFELTDSGPMASVYRVKAVSCRITTSSMRLMEVCIALPAKVIRAKGLTIRYRNLRLAQLDYPQQQDLRQDCRHLHLDPQTWCSTDE